MPDMTLKMFGTQTDTVRKALAFYRDALEKLAKKEDESGVTSEPARKIIAECEGLLEAIAPETAQTDAFKQPPEGFKTPKPWMPDDEKDK